MTYAVVKDSNGNKYIVSNTVKDSDGVEHIVANSVKESDGTPHIIFTDEIIGIPREICIVESDRICVI